MRRFWWLAAAAAATVWTSCSDGTGPAGRLDAELSFVRQGPLAPPLRVVRDSFWAVVGDGRDIRLYYEDPTVPGTDGDDFLRFEVPGSGLYRKPDGTRFLPGDSVLITITVVDPTRFQVEFEPAGLQFNPDQPARLRFYYYHADHDFNEDGVEDAADAEIETELDLWRRAAPGAVWFRVGALKFEESDELDALILSFSQFAVAW